MDRLDKTDAVVVTSNERNLLDLSSYKDFQTNDITRIFVLVQDVKM